MTDGRNVTTPYTDDAYNRVKTITVGSTQTADFFYDLVGNQTKIVDGNGNSIYLTYDKRLLVVQQENGNGGVEYS